MAPSKPNESVRILVIDDEPDLRMLYELTLLREGHQVDTAGTLKEAWAILDSQQYTLVITDVRLPDGLGTEILKGLRAQHRHEKCIVITAYGSAENAVEALKAGAFDYLTKPVDLKQFRAAVAAAVLAAQGKVDAQRPSASLTGSAPSGEGSAEGAQALARLVGESLAMRTVRERVAKVARSMAPVLIHGESGTGKELVARALHANSHRATGAWVAVNCSAIPETLLEAEFFGVKKGAFTGASHDRSGFFRAANGGTLFLDEIGDLPLSMQAKLLRAIQERCIRPLGSDQEEPIDVRIISATHKDLAQEIADGRFRQDLFYRLNVIDMEIPALRDRPEDLPGLCSALLLRLARETGLPAKRLSTAALARIASLPLRGNVRELENLLHRAVALSDGDVLELEETGRPRSDLDTALDPAEYYPRSNQPPADPSSMASAGTAIAPLPSSATSEAEQLPGDLESYLDGIERTILIRALHLTGFNRTSAARLLGLSLRQIRYRIARLKIDAPGEPGETPESSE